MVGTPGSRVGSTGADGWNCAGFGRASCAATGDEPAGSDGSPRLGRGCISDGGARRLSASGQEAPPRPLCAAWPSSRRVGDVYVRAPPTGAATVIVWLIGPRRFGGSHA